MKKPIWISPEAHTWLDARRTSSFADALDDVIAHINDVAGPEALKECIRLLAVCATKGVTIKFGELENEKQLDKENISRQMMTSDVLYLIGEQDLNSNEKV